MKVISLSTGLPREVTWHGISVSTGIYNEPVEGRVPVRKLNLGGDREADRDGSWRRAERRLLLPERALRLLETRVA